jgi:hypothetical protein
LLRLKVRHQYLVHVDPLSTSPETDDGRVGNSQTVT